MRGRGSFFNATLQVRCPVCKRSNGHWCRDERGKCLAIPHRERSKAALDLVMAPLRPLGLVTAGS